MFPFCIYNDDNSCHHRLTSVALSFVYRLVSTLSNMNVTTTAGTGTPAPLLKSTTMKVSTAASAAAASGTPGGKPPLGPSSAGPNAGYVNLNRGAIAPSRILGAVLKIYGDYMKQIISGVEMSFSTLTLPSELNSAFTEVDSFIAAAHYPVTAVTAIVNTLANGLKYENKAYDAVAGTILASPLREPFHRDALQEVYDLYNAMEFIMKKEAAAVQSAASAASALGGAGAGANFHHTRVPFGANAGKNNVSDVGYNGCEQVQAACSCQYMLLSLLVILCNFISALSCNPALFLFSLSLALVFCVCLAAELPLSHEPLL